MAEIGTPLSKSKRYCSVPQCSSYKSATVSIHLFPTNKLLCNKWKDALKIGKPISKCMSVCSKHFLDQDFSQATPNAKLRRLKKGAIPSQNLPVTSLSKSNVKNVVDRSKRKWLMAKEEQHKVDTVAEVEQMVSTSGTQNEDIICENSEANVTCNMNLSTSSYGKYREPLKESHLSFVDKATQTEDTGGSSKFEFVDILDNEKKIQSFTGVNSDIIETLQSCVSRVIAENNGRYDNLLKIKILLVLIKLKLSIPFVCISILFNISPTTCIKYFHDTLHLLVLATKTVVFWPTKEQIVANIPKCFNKFRNTRVVLDCTEVPVQKCKCLQCRIRTYSHYKSGHTLKFLVGITPSGLVSHISPAYGGRVSDKAIFNDSNIISKCDPHDAIMVDKGFRIEEECETNFLKLIRPPFLKQQQQLSKKEADDTADIARARVHVERTIQRIKKFKIMSSQIEWYLISVIDDIMHLICALVNLSSPILADNKFDDADISEDCIDNLIIEIFPKNPKIK